MAEAKAPRSRFSTLLSLAVLAVAAIALAYVAGVMAGRLVATRQGSERPGLEQLGQMQPDQGQQAETPRQKILAPEELQFARALRNQPEIAPSGAVGAKAQPAQAMAEKAQAKEQPKATDTPGAGKNAQGEGQASASQGQSPGAKPGQAPGQGNSPETTAKNEAGELADYVFQMGAFRDEASVDALRQRLEGHGLRTRMQREGKLYLVLVLLRGDKARAEEIPALASELKLGEPILLSRKKVAP